MATVAFNLRLDTKRDADLIAWLDLLVASGENKSDFARDAMRRAMRNEVTLPDVLRAVERIDARLAAGAVVAAAGGNGVEVDGDDDGEFDAALDAIGA